MGLLNGIGPGPDDGDSAAGYARRSLAGAQFDSGDGNDAGKAGDADWKGFIDASAGGPGVYYPTPTPDKWDSNRPGAITAAPAPPLPPPDPFKAGAAPLQGYGANPVIADAAQGRLPAPGSSGASYQTGVGRLGVPVPAALSSAGAGPATPAGPAPSTPGVSGGPVPAAASARPRLPPSAAPQGPYRTIAVGDYQMPLVGTSADAALGAQASQGRGNASGQNAWSNFFNRGADALGSISRGGSVLGAVRGQYDDPQSQRAQSQNQTQQMLIKRGVPQDIAATAVQPGNGALLNAALGQVLGKSLGKSFGGAQRLSGGGATGQRGSNRIVMGSDGHWYQQR